MSIAAAHLGLFGRLRAEGASASLAQAGKAEANARAPRELSALGRAVESINSPPLKPDSLAGKVVVVQFWTYTCINWLRTLPTSGAGRTPTRSTASS